MASPNWAALGHTLSSAKLKDLRAYCQQKHAALNRKGPSLPLSFLMPIFNSAFSLERTIRDHVITHQKSADPLKAEDVTGDVDKKV